MSSNSVPISGANSPNFFTKHFYFLGKAQGLTTYPVIFDNRVANGLVKVASEDPENLNMVQISAVPKPNIYIDYIQFALSEAKRIGCQPDQIEYYLFSLWPFICSIKVIGCEGVALKP